MALLEVKVPDIGDFKDVTIIEILVKPGDLIVQDQSLITVESDKASMEIPSSQAGIVKALNVELGDKVSEGSVILTLDADAANAEPPKSDAHATVASTPAPQAVNKESPGAAHSVSTHVSTTPLQKVTVPPHEPAQVQLDKLPHASPSIRKMARELGVPLAEVAGSGSNGRITLEDLQQFVNQVMNGTAKTQAQRVKGGVATAGSGVGLDLLPLPEVDFAKFGPIERKPLPRIRKISGANLHRNWVMIPHVTNCEDADITELEAFRVQLNKESEKAKSNVKYTLLAFLIKACVAALKKYPDFNASLEGDELVYKKYFNIGFAADTPHGLMVPVIKEADAKGLAEIAAETAALAAKAREGKISPSEMTGGCFSISSLGGFGGTYFSPIINAPEVAILGVCRSAMRPVWDGSAFQPRLILPLSLSYDHRVIDGAAAARFNAYLRTILADFRRVLL